MKRENEKMVRSYKLTTPKGATFKRFSNLIEAFKYFKIDCPDLIPSDMLKRPLLFADGYSFNRADLGKVRTVVE